MITTSLSLSHSSTSTSTNFLSISIKKKKSSHARENYLSRKCASLFSLLLPAPDQPPRSSQEATRTTPQLFLPFSFLWSRFFSLLLFPSSWFLVFFKSRITNFVRISKNNLCSPTLACFYDPSPLTPHPSSPLTCRLMNLLLLLLFSSPSPLAH